VTNPNTCIGISFPPKVEEKRVKRIKRTEEGEVDKKKETALQPLMGTFGKVDKEEAVQKLLWATLDNEKLVKFYTCCFHIKLSLNFFYIFVSYLLLVETVRFNSCHPRLVQ
jgi:hypothetical protein